MESFSETRKRQAADDDDSSEKLRSPKNRRRSGTETIRFLVERQADVRAQHGEEMELRKAELDVKRQEVAGNNSMMTQILTFSTFYTFNL